MVGHEERGTDLQRARALAIEILANERPVNVFTMKQFRDVHDPSRAAYQSLVRIERTIKTLFELREIEEPLHLRIQEYPSLPLIQLLGLVATLASDQKGGVTYMLRPVRPFWMRMAWNESLGKRMMYRCGSEEWQGLDEKGWRPYFGDATAPEVDVPLSDLIDDGRPHRIDFLTHEWKRLGGKGMKLSDARDAVETIRATDLARDDPRARVGELGDRDALARALEVPRPEAEGPR